MDSPGIEPGFHPCEGYVLPFNYEPSNVYYIVLSAKQTSFAYGVGVATGEGEEMFGPAGGVASLGRVN